MMYNSTGNVNGQHDNRHWIWVSTLLSDNHPYDGPIFGGRRISWAFLRQESLEKSVWPTTASGDFGQDGYL